MAADDRVEKERVKIADASPCMVADNLSSFCNPHD